MTLKIAPYGRCPSCGAVGASRERRPNGDDRCVKGHKYASRDAILTQVEWDLLNVEPVRAFNHTLVMWEDCIST